MLFTLSGEAAEDDPADARGAVAVNTRDAGGATRRHSGREAPDELIELAVRQLAVFN